MELPRVTPESLGVPSQAVLDLLDELDRYGIEMHGMMLLRHGKVFAQGWWKPYEPQTQHIMFSFSKSLTSTAIGFAWQEGILSLEERLVDLFPDKIPEHPSENLQKAQIRHLLMMGCGHETEIADLGRGDPDWIRSFLHHPFVYEPGTHFLYNTAGTNLLSAILTKKTGLTLTQFLEPRLFRPLGMSQNIRCQPLVDGTEAGGYGYSLTVEDMARFVQFVANEGQWEGRQLLQKEWFQMATSKQIDNPAPGLWAGDPDWHAGYGFQFWRCAGEGIFRGDGAFGQFGVVCKNQDLVVIFQSASMRLQAVLSAVWDKLLPQLSDHPLQETDASLLLQHQLAHLELHPLLGMRNPGAEESLHGAEYLPDQPVPSLADWIGGVGKFQPAGGKLLSLGFVCQGDDVRLRFVQDNGTFDLAVGMTGHFARTEIDGVPYGANGAWRAKDKLEVHLRSARLAGGKRFVFHFAGSKLAVSADSTIPEIGGLADPLTPTYTFTLREGEINTKTKMYWEVND